MADYLLLLGHGSHYNPNSSAPVYAHAHRLAHDPRFAGVHTAFWKEEPSFARATDRYAPGDDVTVVPVFIASGFFTEEIIPREMRLAGAVTRRDGLTLRYTGPIGAHPRMADVIVQRAREAGAGPGTAVAVLGHGTPRNPNSEKNVMLQAERVRRAGLFAEVVSIFIDQEPLLTNLRSMVRAEHIVVVPFFIAEGWHVGETIPEELAAIDGARAGSERGLRYAAAVGTHPGIADVLRVYMEEAAGW